MKNVVVKVTLGVFAFLTLIGLLLFYLANQYLANLPPTPQPIDCSKGYRNGMTPNEVAALMDIPLVKLNWLPDNLQTAPEVKPHGLEWVDSSNGVTCVVRISHPDFSIDVIALRDVIRSTLYPVDCGLLEDMNTSSVHCSGEFATSKGYIAISMFTSLPLEIAQKIADGISVIES